MNYRNFVSRRKFMKGALVAGACFAIIPCHVLGDKWGANRVDLVSQTDQIFQSLHQFTAGYAVDMSGHRIAGSEVSLSYVWDGTVCKASISNKSEHPVKIKEVVLFDIIHDLSGTTPIYGEGFSMCACTAGTIGNPINLLDTDAKTFKLNAPKDAISFYGMTLFSLSSDNHLLFGFTSCKKFLGKINIYPKKNRMQILLDARIPLNPGETWDLEKFTAFSGVDRNVVFDTFAKQICQNHPRRSNGPVAKGWCSWYCFGENVTVEQLSRNLNIISKNYPELKYIQIDDGWQPQMGDWDNPGRIKEILKTIKSRGFEPAIWVAPFVASRESKLFKEHSDWFVKGINGEPVESDQVYREGWRLAPWYILDGTHPGVQNFLEETFRRMRQEWGCTYFKLDANSWGACPNVTFYDSNATAVEAFRRGQEAINRGAGADSFILGCNSPTWPSLGLINGNRASLDILGMDWIDYCHTARVYLLRNWQNNRLWWNDPDCIRIQHSKNHDEMMFHATALYASGGMILSSDDLSMLTPEKQEIIKKLASVKGVAASFNKCNLSVPIPGHTRWEESTYGFSDPSMEVGWMNFSDHIEVAVFNWQEKSKTISVDLPFPGVITDVWSGEKLGIFSKELKIKGMSKHSAKLLRIDPK